MGQYYKLVNEEKRPVVVAGDLHGISTFQWLYTNQARVLVWLLRQSSEGGGGDIPNHTRFSVLGR